MTLINFIKKYSHDNSLLLKIILIFNEINELCYKSNELTKESLESLLRNNLQEYYDEDYNQLEDRLTIEILELSNNHDIFNLASEIHKRINPNKCNIVFKSSDNSLLMTGDAEKTVSSMIDKDLSSTIRILKAPHHGTDSHFYKFHIVFDNVLISHDGIKYKPPVYSKYLTICHNLFKTESPSLPKTPYKITLNF